jgi:hypothetical protein
VWVADVGREEFEKAHRGAFAGGGDQWTEELGDVQSRRVGNAAMRDRQYGDGGGAVGFALDGEDDCHTIAAAALSRIPTNFFASTLLRIGISTCALFYLRGHRTQDLAATLRRLCIHSGPGCHSQL